MNIISFTFGNIVVTDYGRSLGPSKQYSIYDRISGKSFIITPEDYAFITHGETKEDREVSAVDTFSDYLQDAAVATQTA